MGSALSTFLTIAATYIVTDLIQNYVWANRKADGTAKARWPASPKKLPFFFNGYQDFRSKGCKALTAWSKSDGLQSLFSVQLVKKRIIVLNQGSLVRKAFVELDQCNSSRPAPPGDLVENVMTDMGKTVFSAPFELYWSRLRRGIHKNQQEQLVNLNSMIRHFVDGLCERIQKQVESGTATIEAGLLRQWTDRLALEGILFMVVGATQVDSDKLDTIISLHHEVESMQSDAWYDRYAAFVPLARTVATLVRGSKPIVRVRNKLLDLILGLRNEDFNTLEEIEPSKNDPNPEQLTPDQIALNLMHLTLHGYTFLSAALFALIQRVASLSDLQAQLLHHPELVRATVAETLRCHPPATLWSHTSRVDHEFENWRVDEGTQLVVNLDRIHFDPATYPDPHRFDPTRFLKQNNNNSILDDKTAPATDHLAFGAGRRACLGKAASQQIMAQTLAGLVSAFKMKGGNADTSVEKPGNVFAWTGRSVVIGTTVEFSRR
ncbi:cytochrome P450 [Syncephalastrum racemosum]|uniref:Cytochrome P450 n=1 Tax=Syncephalastrum racemosum TaxID=13706 RepID=A0A1X2HIQ4_SYNRA|nr:cytochrome P450 [Syncephalastrum racemosum]